MVAVTVPPTNRSTVTQPSSVSVVICADTSEQWDDIDRVLVSLRRQTRRPDQIVLVVDHQDQLLQWAADAWSETDEDGEMRVDVVANTQDRGLAGARNTGVAWSWGEVVGFLDSHVVAADRHWIETILDDFAGDEGDIAGVGGGAVADWGSGDPPSWMPDEFGWAVGCSYAGLPADLGEVSCLLGCNMSFRRDVFAKVGGFSAGPRDASEFCVRIRQRYPLARLLFDPDLEVFHRMTNDKRTFARFRRRCFEEGRSTAAIARSAGSDRDLVSARAFSPAAAPMGVLRGIADGLHGRAGGFQRAGALVVGLAWASAGYTRGRLGRG